MRALAIAAGAAAALTLFAACDTQQVDANPPTVTYSYTDETFDEVAMRADAYCEQQYGRDARLVDRDRSSRGREATFACD